MKIAFTTLGCKVNQFDTGIMSQEVSGENHQVVPYDEKADLYVINTCTVTENADLESRQWVKKARQINPRAKIIVTGCYAQTHPEEVQKIHGVHLILGNEEKKKIASYLPLIQPEFSEDPVSCVGDIAREKIFKQPQIESFLDKTRAFLKVQDGCNTWCSFCIIPRARGRSRSFNSREIIAQLQQFEQKGYLETVFTGINLGSYGLDLSPKTSLPDLFRQIEKHTFRMHFRFSSIEPDYFTDDLIDTFANSNRVCRHFHIPLQSGDPEILKKMNRKYSPGRYREIIERISKKMPEASIGMDVMAGFPGETKEKFQATYEFIQDLPVTYLHVFPYSERKGTLAVSFPGSVSAQLKKERAVFLRQLGKIKGDEFKKRFIGRKIKVLIEENREKEICFFGKGLSDNYIRVLIKNGGHLESNQYIEVVPQTLEDDKLICTLN